MFRKSSLFLYAWWLANCLGRTNAIIAHIKTLDSHFLLAHKKAVEIINNYAYGYNLMQLKCISIHRTVFEFASLVLATSFKKHCSFTLACAARLCSDYIIAMRVFTSAMRVFTFSGLMHWMLYRNQCVYLLLKCTVNSVAVHKNVKNM